ncbi:hypothetical protein D3C72_765540 [compost metagenome]
MITVTAALVTLPPVLTRPPPAPVVALPMVVSTVFTSGWACISLVTARATLSVSSMAEPAGRAIEMAVSPLSPWAKKPLGISGTRANEPIRRATAMPIVIQRWCMAACSTFM